MKIVLFVSPGILGPYVFYHLTQRKDVSVVCAVLPRGKHSISADELLMIAQHRNVPTITPPTPMNDPSFVAHIRAYDPDLILVASYDSRIPDEILRCAKRAAVNLHPSLLPKYRGACPEFWALRNGERKTGVSLHHLTSEFDAGNIIAQEFVPIEPLDTLGSLLYKLGRAAYVRVDAFIGDLLNGAAIAGLPQDHSRATPAPLVNATDLRIDWNLRAQEICNLVRAANPLGGAWSLFRNYQLKIWFGRVADSAAVSALCGDQQASSAGSLFFDSGTGRLFVKCSDGFFEPVSVQYALFYIADARHFVEQSHVVHGERLE